jgi:hypothetical protein
LAGRTAVELAKFAGAETVLLSEGLTESRVGIVTGGECNLRNIYGAHAQLSPGSFHAHAADVAGNVLAQTGCEQAVKVRHREASNRRQYFAVERFVDVLADVQLDIVDPCGTALKPLYVRPRMVIIVYQNGCSLFQMYHFSVAPLALIIVPF